MFYEKFYTREIGDGCVFAVILEVVALWVVSVEHVPDWQWIFGFHVQPPSGNAYGCLTVEYLSNELNSVEKGRLLISSEDDNHDANGVLVCREITRQYLCPSISA